MILHLKRWQKYSWRTRANASYSGSDSGSYSDR